MSIKNVTINPGCISCGLCEFIAPELFEVTDVSRLKEDANFTQHEKQLKEAAEQCPVRVISYNEESDDDTTPKK
jgi:ferredoxin